MTLEGSILERFFARGFLKELRGIHYRLVCLASGLDKQFPLVSASHMPQYTEAMDAIKRYEIALKQKLDIVNNRNRIQRGYE